MVLLPVVNSLRNRKVLLWAAASRRLERAPAMLALVVVICAFLLPRLNIILQDVNTLMLQASSIAGDLETLTKEILDADIGGILSNASQLVKNTDAGVQQSLVELQQALEKLNSLDFDGLNQSIADLQAIVEPLSKLFGGR